MEFAKEFEVGRTYFLETEDQDSSFEVFRSLTKDRPGLCITREHPSHLKEKYGLDGVKFGRLSTSGERTAIGPRELNLLGLTIKRFVSDESGVLLLDGISYLISKNNISKVIRFIRSLQERISGKTSIFLIVLNASEIEEKNIQRLKGRLDIETKSLREITSRGKETPTNGKGEHLVSQVRSMMEFLEEQGHHIEREVDRMERGPPSEVSKSRGFKVLSDEIKILREENNALKNELEKIKAERQEEGEDEVFEEEIVNEVVATVEEEKEDIEEQMEKIEEEKGKVLQRGNRVTVMIETLRKLEDEVGSLRDEVKAIKEESSKGDVEDVREDEDTDIIDSESRPTSSDLPPEGGFEVIQEPKLEDEYLSEDMEEEQIEKITSDRIIYDEDKTILKSGFKISGDIESQGDIEVQKGVTLKGSLKSEEDITIDENTTIQGKIISKSGDVKIGKDCKVTGEISGNTISISERSKVEDINAKKDVVLENNTRVRNILSQEDVRIFENVEIDGGIDYGGQLDLNGKYTNIRGRIRPIDEGVVKEKWA